VDKCDISFSRRWFEFDVVLRFFETSVAHWLNPALNSASDFISAKESKFTGEFCSVKKQMLQIYLKGNLKAKKLQNKEEKNIWHIILKSFESLTN